MEIRPTQVPQFVRLITDFGPGEAQVLAIALEEPGSLVIIDKRLAREVVSLQNLRVTGTAGVLLKAKQKGYISAITPLLDKLLPIKLQIKPLGTSCDPGTCRGITPIKQFWAWEPASLRSPASPVVKRPMVSP